MRRFKVWANCSSSRCPNHSGDEYVLEFADDTPEEQIEEECKQACDVLLGNITESGWEEEESK